MEQGARDAFGRFVNGIATDRRCPVGTIRIRTRHGRGGEQRAFIKVLDPGAWVLLAHHVWESAHGPIPRGMALHHKDGDKLNDNLENLSLMTKAQHLAEHRPEYADRISEAARRAIAIRWARHRERMAATGE